MWFDSWSALVRILLLGTAGYATLVIVLRLSGKRTLAKLNAFDWAVSVAFGSTLATVLLGGDVSWSEGALALALLAGLQFALASITTRWPRMRRAVTARPTLLLQDGVILADALSRHRVTPEEIRQAVRAAGSGDLSSVAAVVLETDGSLSVIGTARAGDRSALDGVAGPGSDGSRPRLAG